MKLDKFCASLGRVLCVILFASIVGCFGASRLPTDEEIVSKWNGIKSGLKELLILLDEQPKGIVGIGPEGVMLEVPSRQVAYEKAGMSHEDYSKFVEKMKSLGVLSLNRYNDEVAFLVIAKGFASKGVRVFYVYRETPPKESVIRNMSDFRRKAGGWTVAYIPMERGWYAKIVW